MHRTTLLSVLSCSLIALLAAGGMTADRLDSLLERTGVRKDHVRIEYPDAVCHRLLPQILCYKGPSADLRTGFCPRKNEREEV